MSGIQAIVDFPFSAHPLAIGIQMEGDVIVGLDLLWRDAEPATPNAPPSPAAARTLEQLRRELHAYAHDPHARFHSPVALRGTAFQQRVWQALREIPAGTTLTYGELAHNLGSGARAVANACRRNPVPLIVPCHRVVAWNGLGGYGGATEGELVQFKQRLLDHERNP
jgi:methylated-DNA-[protein]-cysteine S-methyltransferase